MSDSKIFISYRREDSQAITGRLFDRLEGAFGESVPFMDVDGIPLGSDFRSILSDRLSSCNVAIVVIGPRWEGTTPQGKRRIEQANDYVRIEIATALKRGIPVIPVLVEGGEIPPPESIPEDVRDLAYRQGIVVDSGVDFRVHAERLIRAIRGMLVTAVSGRNSSQSNEGSTEHLQFLEGAWIDKGTKTRLYARVVGPQLLMPYCFGNDNHLTAHYYDFRRIGDSLFARFQWQKELRTAGYTQMKIVSPDRLVGGWWYADEVPEELTKDITKIHNSMPGMRPSELNRLPRTAVPEWAENFFQNPGSK